ncbi:MAG: hypothetical protein EU529_02880 [Promethearchaeota archaeon]|nr:MAG: hypothetical protein EU529_02880 [Candidatus Lokiarchaeota archaeon]
MANDIIRENYFNTEVIISPTQNNLMKILQINGPMIRRDLVNQLKIARTTIYDNLVKLQKRKVIEKFTRNDGKRGRPLVFWKIK